MGSVEEPRSSELGCGAWVAGSPHGAPGRTPNCRPYARPPLWYAGSAVVFPGRGTGRAKTPSWVVACGSRAADWAPDWAPTRAARPTTHDARRTTHDAGLTTRDPTCPPYAAATRHPDPARRG